MQLGASGRLLELWVCLLQEAESGDSPRQQVLPGGRADGGGGGWGMGGSRGDGGGDD